MNQNLKISILDQSIVRAGHSAADAIKETIETAILAEELGFHRFWISEHHNADSIAGSTPEVLMVKLADVTSQIRVGSGGIMLPNHSALKVAENFRMLETLFPGRIDLGMGRAPGTDRITSSVLNPSNDFSEESYLRQLAHLQHYFSDTAATQYGSLLAIPQSESVPEQWILSSSGGSSKIAARFGMGLAIARFINGHASREVLDEYLENFTPTEHCPTPRALVAISVLCAQTEEEAMKMRKLMDYRLFQFEKGNFEKPGTYKSIEHFVFSEDDVRKIRNNSGRIISGTPGSVKAQIIELAETLGVDEVMITTMTDNKASRLRSFELVAEAFDLKKQTATSSLVEQPVLK